MKYALKITFKGSEFAGWQDQPKKTTVQGILEEKLKYLYAGKNITIKGAGRTDSGVHAIEMTATFMPPEYPIISCKKLIKALNCILPSSIHINDISEVNSTFDARFSALGKAYTYVTCISDSPGPFIHELCYHNPRFINLESLYKATNHLIGEHDFSSFTVELNKTKKNPIRRIYRIEVNQFDKYVCVTFIGKSFLYKMVRSLMGTLIQVAEGRISPDHVKKVLDQKDRSKAHITAPPHGLYLMKVFYDEDSIKKYHLSGVPFFESF